MDKFSVGEVVIYVRPGSPYFGEAVTVLSALVYTYFDAPDQITGKIGESAFVYEITNFEETNTEEFYAEPHHLRKKPQHKDSKDIQESRLAPITFEDMMKQWEKVEA